MSGPRITDAAVGTVARIRVERGATAEFPVAEKVHGGWQTGVNHYPDESVADVLGIYVQQPREVHENVLVSATEEAIGRYDGDVDAETGAAVDDWGYSACQRQAFVAGALFESGRNSPHIRRAVIEELVEKARARMKALQEHRIVDDTPEADEWETVARTWGWLRAELEGDGE